MDIDELTELRARQRTFDGRPRPLLVAALKLMGWIGAYMRTALSMLSYALLILKIFSPEFAKRPSLSPPLPFLASG